MKKTIFLSCMALGLFFTVNSHAQQNARSLSETTTQDVAAAKTNQMEAKIAELDKAEAELKASGVTGDAYNQRLEIIQKQKAQLKNQMDPANKKSLKSAATEQSKD